MAWWMWMGIWIIGIPIWITIVAFLRYYEVSDLADYRKGDVRGALIFWPVVVPGWLIYKWSEWVLNVFDPEDRKKKG